MQVLATNETVTPELAEGFVTMLGRWGWPAGRPTWVSWVPSQRRLSLAESLARHVAERGRLPLVSVVRRSRTGAPQAEMANSAHACLNVHGAFDIGEAPPPGAGLIVDDTYGSGWTMTVIADLLADSGIGPIYPAVLLRGVPQ